MMRAFFLALGLCCCTVGGECLLIDKAVVVTTETASGPFGTSDAPRYREVSPPDWAPWSLLATGSVVVLWTFTIPQRVKQ